MLGGYRFIDITFRVLIGGIAAVVVAFIVHVAVSNYAEISKVYAAYQANAEKDQKETEESIQDNCIGIAPAPSIACISNYLTAYYKKQSTNADLKAQQDMAQWAFMTFLASLGGVLVGIGGIVYVRLTLREARETTRAAIASVDQQRELFVAENRPWIAIDDPRLGKIVDRDFVNGKETRILAGFQPTLNAKNVGKFPATNCYMQGNWRFVFNANEDPIPIIAEDIERLKISAMEGSGGAKLMVPNVDVTLPAKSPIPVQNVAIWLSGHARFFYYVVMRYRFPAMIPSEPDKLAVTVVEFKLNGRAEDILSTDGPVQMGDTSATVLPDITMAD